MSQDWQAILRTAYRQRMTDQENCVRDFLGLDHSPVCPSTYDKGCIEIAWVGSELLYVCWIDLFDGVGCA